MKNRIWKPPAIIKVFRQTRLKMIMFSTFSHWKGIYWS